MSGIFIHPKTGNVGIGLTNPRTALEVNGTITASNISVIGDFVRLNTVTSNTEQMVIENAGTGPALKVTQTGANSIAEFYDDGNVLALKIADGGNVGIGTTLPQAKLHVNGNVIVPSLSAQWTLSGGGEITWTGAFVKWSSRVIVLPIDLSYGISGFFDISCPTSGTITGYINASGSSLITCTSSGIPLSSWHALYYIIQQGSTYESNQNNFVVVNYTNSTYKIDSSWLLIAMRSGDMGSLKWIPGNENIPSSGTINLVTGYRSWQVINKFYYSENIVGGNITQIGNFKSITISASGTAFVSFNCLHRASSFTGVSSAVYWSLRKNSTTISASALGTRWLSFAAAAFPSTNTSSDNWQPLSMVWSGTVSSGDIIHVYIVTIETTLGINDAYLSITVI